MTRNTILLVLLINIVSCSDRGPTERQNSSKSLDFVRPNIVFVITDDQGYGDLSIMGNPVLKTPNIDDLAEESVQLEDYHVSPTCSPTRAALLTGHWTNRTGAWHTIMGRSMLRENEVTIADLLSENGYHTAMIGKWHLGDNYPYRPMDRGFSEAYYHGGGGVGQTPDYWNNSYFDGSYFRNGVAEEAKGFVTDVFFDEAIRYIDSVKDSDQPFFTYISTNAPHGPMHSPESYASPFSEFETRQQHFFGMISNIDDNVGKLRSYLDENELADNTIFIFTTDNGTSAGEEIFNAGMRGKKGSEYDGGHRVPFFLHWPKGNLDAKKVITPLTAHIDILPTLLELTGSANTKSIEFDGRSLAPLIKGETESWSDRILITDSQRILHPEKWRKSATMTDRWRLINGEELYDMDADPSQEKDVASQHPEVVAELRGFYDNWWDELVPTFGEPTAIYLGAPEANPSTLTSHDWLGVNGPVPWHQRHIRDIARPKESNHEGYWWVNFVDSGKYSFELRRWPAETRAAIRDSLKAESDVPGDRAFRSHPGKSFMAEVARIKIGEETHRMDLTESMESARFEMEVGAGKNKIEAAFIDSEGVELGAYFLVVERL